MARLSEPLHQVRLHPAVDLQGAAKARHAPGTTASLHFAGPVDSLQLPSLWLSRGKTNKDIGDILGLSPRTINKHLEQVFVKLGVENCASAAIKATRLLLDPD